MARGRTVGKTGHRFSSYLRHCGLAAAALLLLRRLCRAGLGRRRPGQGHARGHRQRRLCAARLRHERIRRRQRARRQQRAGHHLQSADRCLDRSPRVADSRLCRRGAARSRRQGHSRGAVATGQGQYHAGRREIFHRSVAGVMERAAAQPAAGGHRRPGAPRPRGRSSRAQRAPGRCAAAGDRRAGARACVDAADFHPLHLRRAGQYHGVRRSHQGAADADLRRADQVRSCRCRGRAAARDRRHRSRIARRQRAGALQLPGQGRRPQLPRRRRLCARYRRRRQQTGRAKRRTRRANRSAAKCGAGNHRARNGPARGGERSCRAQRRGGGSSAGKDGKTRHRTTGNNRRA